MSRRLVTVPLVLGPWLLASLVACTTGPGAPSPSITDGPSAPLETARTSQSPSASALQSPEISTSPTPPTEPPTATLRGSQGPGVAGDVGTYTIGTFGSDAPWLPGEPIEVKAGERLTVELPGVTLEQWTATIGTAPDTNPKGLGEGSGSIAFDAPPAGSWSLMVSVYFAGGSALYFWALTVR